MEMKQLARFKPSHRNLHILDKEHHIKKRANNVYILMLELDEIHYKLNNMPRSVIFEVLLKLTKEKIKITREELTRTIRFILKFNEFRTKFEETI